MKFYLLHLHKAQLLTGYSYKSVVDEKCCACVLLHNKLNLGAIFDIAGRKTSLTFFRDKRYWDLICVKAKKIISHKYMLNGRRTFDVISEIVGSSVLVPIQNSVKGFFENLALSLSFSKAQRVPP